MAWISVHESIIGKKLRSLSKAAGCSQNEAIGLLVRLWLWGIKNADRTGLLIDADKDDIAAVLTNGLDRNVEAEDVVEAMIKTEWIDDEDGKLYLHDWEEWQQYWYKLIDESAKATERKRRQRERERKEKRKSTEKNLPKMNPRKRLKRKQRVIVLSLKNCGPCTRLSAGTKQRPQGRLAQGSKRNGLKISSLQQRSDMQTHAQRKGLKNST